MSLQAPKQEIVLPPEGTHLARCYRLIQIGTVQETFEGEPYMANKIQLTFELPDELHVFKEGDEAKPFVISQEYTLSMNDRANLRKLIQGIKGRKLTQEEADLFDVESLIGESCLVTIIHKTSAKGRVRAEIATAGPLMKGQDAKPAINMSQILTYGENWDEATFEKLPGFLKDKMKTSREYLVMKGQKVGEDGIPF